jgi:hypothetical protein
MIFTGQRKNLRNSTENHLFNPEFWYWFWYKCKYQSLRFSAWDQRQGNIRFLSNRTNHLQNPTQRSYSGKLSYQPFRRPDSLHINHLGSSVQKKFGGWDWRVRGCCIMWKQMGRLCIRRDSDLFMSVPGHWTSLNKEQWLTQSRFDIGIYKNHHLGLMHPEKCSAWADGIFTSSEIEHTIASFPCTHLKSKAMVIIGRIVLAGWIRKPGNGQPECCGKPLEMLSSSI